jgi:hypothetical protein
MAATEKNVEIVYAHHLGSNKPGDKVAVSELEARRLVKAGRANYATVAAATTAEGEEGKAKTARTRGAAKPGDGT